MESYKQTASKTPRNKQKMRRDVSEWKEKKEKKPCEINTLFVKYRLSIVAAIT